MITKTFLPFDGPLDDAEVHYGPCYKVTVNTVLINISCKIIVHTV